MDEHVEQSSVVISEPTAILEPKKTPVHFREWLSVLIHTHTQLQPDASWTLKDRQVLQKWRGEGGLIPLQFSLPLLAEVSERLGKKGGGFFVVDTPHAAHSLDEYHPDLYAPKLTKDDVRELRRQLFTTKKLDDTIKMISENLALRQKAAEYERQKRKLKDRIFPGVEADILNSSGKLDVNDEVLRQLDVTVASFHKDEWIDVNGKEPSYDDILQAYLNLSSSSSVDVIGHPELPKEPLSPAQWDKWDQIFKNLAKRGMCLEIALSGLIYPEKREGERSQLLQFLKRAKGAGVGLIFNVDFHRLESFFLDTLPPDTKHPEGLKQPEADKARTELENLTYLATSLAAGDKQIKAFEETFNTTLAEIFKQSEGGLVKYSTTFARPIYNAIRQLQDVGITPEDVVNGDIERFRAWVEERKVWKKAAEFGEDFDPTYNIRTC